MNTKSDFDRRRQPHDEAVAAEKQRLEKEGHLVLPLGVERYPEDIRGALSKMNKANGTIKHERHQPDLLDVDPQTENGEYVELKVAKTIERDSYNACKRKAETGGRLIVKIHHPETDARYEVPFGALAFKDSWAVVSEFPEDKRMPVDDDGWINPRLWPDGKYLRWKRSHPSGSGTAFRYFDFSAMEQYRVIEH